MKLLRSYRLMAFSLVLLSIAGLCVAMESVGLMLLAGTPAALSWYITEGPRGRSLPRWVSNILVLVFSLHVIVDLWQHPDDFRGVLGRYAVWLTVIKLYERRTARDEGHLLALSLLLMLTGCLISAKLLFGVFLLVYAGLGLYVLLLYQMHASYEDARLERQQASNRDMALLPSVRPIIGRFSGLHFRGLVMATGLMGFVLSGIIFASFPRGLGQGLVNQLSADEATRRAGFSKDVDLVGGSRISDSRVKVMEVQVLGAQGQPIRPSQPILLRGSVLNRYLGKGQWAASEPSNLTRVADTSHPAGVWLADPQPRSGLTLTYEITLQRPLGALFTPLTPIWIDTEDTDRLSYDPTTQIFTEQPSGIRLLSYRVRQQTVLQDFELPSVSSRVPPRMRPDNAFGREIRDIADAILTEAGVPSIPDRAEGEAAYWNWCRTAANALHAHFQSEDFTYTTDLSNITIDPLEDPIVQFITETKRGHCEYYASALTALCRSIRIPARMVTGFVAYHYDDDNERFNIVEGNAHAWMEVAVGPNRWMTLDPTPPETLREIHDIEDGFGSYLSSVYNSLEGGFAQRIAEFDRASQSNLASTLDQGWIDRLSRFMDDVKDLAARINRAFRLGPAGYIWMGLVGLALVIAVVALAKLMRRSGRLRRLLQLRRFGGRRSHQMMRQLGFYLDTITLLNRHGIRKPEWMPPRQFAADVEVSRPAAGAALREIVDLFYAARFANIVLSKAQTDRARELVETLGSELRR